MIQPMWLWNEQRTPVDSLQMKKCKWPTIYEQVFYIISHQCKREPQWVITVMPVRVTILEKEISKCCWVRGGRARLIQPPGEWKLVQSLCKTACSFLKLEIALSHNPGCTHLKDMNTLYQKTPALQNFNQNVEPNKMTRYRWMNQEIFAFQID